MLLSERESSNLSSALGRKFMLHKARLSIINKEIIKILLCIAIIVGVLIFSDMTPIKFVKGPEKIDIDNIDLDDYAGKYVEAKIAYVYDYFLEEETYEKHKDGSRSEGEVTARYYITDVNLSQYIALRAEGSELMNKFDVVLDNTGIALGNDTQPTAYSYRGSFVKLSDEEYTELKSFMTQVGLEEDMYSDYIFKVNYVGKFRKAIVIVFCVIIVISAFVALLTLIRALIGCYAKEIRRFAVDNGIPFKQLCTELDAATEISKVWINDRYTAYIMENRIKILKNEDYIWAYYKEIRTQRNGGITKEREIALSDRNKRFAVMSVASEEAVRDILGIYAESQPQMVIGFNEDLQNMFRENFDQFLLLPYQINRSNEETTTSREPLQETMPSKETAITEETASSKETAPSEEYVTEKYVRETYVPEEYVPETYETTEQKNSNNNLY